MLSIFWRLLTNSDVPLISTAAIPRTGQQTRSFVAGAASRVGAMTATRTFETFRKFRAKPKSGRVVPIATWAAFQR